MNQPQPKITQVHWHSIFPSLHLFKSFKLALGPSKIILALAFLILIILAGKGLDLIYWGNQVKPAQSLNGPFTGSSASGVFQTLLNYQTKQVMDLTLAINPFDLISSAGQHHSPSAAGPLLSFTVIAPYWLFVHYPVFAILFSLICLTCYAFFATAITRTAAMQITLDHHITISEALVFAKKHWLSAFTAPLLPILLISVLGLGGLSLIFGLGLLHWPGLNILGAGLYPVALLLGLAITLLGTCAITSSQFLLPAIAIESADTFDAISRSYSLVLGQMLKWLMYNALNLLIFLVTHCLIGFILLTSLSVTRFFIHLGFSDAQTTSSIIDQATLFIHQGINVATGTNSVAVFLIALSAAGIMLCLAAYALSYILTSQTWIYLLLRKANDDTALDDIHLTTTPITAKLTPPTQSELDEIQKTRRQASTQNND